MLLRLLIWGRSIRYVLLVPSCQVTTTQRRRDRRIRSHHHQEKRREVIGAQSFKKRQTSRCSSLIPNSILDYHHERHSMVSNPHMSNGQKRYSHSSQSQTIRSLFQFFRRSRVAQMSSQRKSMSPLRARRRGQRQESRPQGRHIRCSSRR